MTKRTCFNCKEPREGNGTVLCSVCLRAYIDGRRDGLKRARVAEVMRVVRHSKLAREGA